MCKPESHPPLTEYLAGVAIDERVETVKRGRPRLRYAYRWMGNLPQGDGKDALFVNCISIEITNPNGKTTHRSCFVTNLPVDRENVIELADRGRARWKVENETVNTSGPRLQYRAQFRRR
ncbi:hypothetical protein [Allomesorhizobium camelthorni]|uniref:Uncharacterized protein n=1 Tax=Allomesorhizobium camelthorni TaxID=475069 RepID=A0A6G4WPG3_9HYPH|nr:hypothetical protein [Mesorhizobium camelthorni]NGO56000.1 hypothetical protein [Mesorhizobium camelthorni]